MPDFRLSVHGQYTPELTWSFGARLTSAATLATLLANWSNAWALSWTNATTGLGQYYPTATSMEYCRVAELDATMHETQNVQQAEVHAGTAAGDTLPYLNAVVISQRSSFSKRYTRGRFYLPAMEETFVNNNVVPPAVVANVKTSVQAVFQAMIADGSNFFVTSLKPHKDGTGQYAKSPITSWTVSNKPARQSRRVKKQVAVYT